MSSTKPVVRHDNLKTKFLPSYSYLADDLHAGAYSMQKQWPHSSGNWVASQRPLRGAQGYLDNLFYNVLTQNTQILATKCLLAACNFPIAIVRQIYEIWSINWDWSSFIDFHASSFRLAFYEISDIPNVPFPYTWCHMILPSISCKEISRLQINLAWSVDCNEHWPWPPWTWFCCQTAPLCVQAHTGCSDIALQAVSRYRQCEITLVRTTDTLVATQAQISRFSFSLTRTCLSITS